MAEDFDKNEPATPYKLEQAKKKGQVAKSADFVSVAVFVVAIVYLNWKGFDHIIAQFKTDRAILLLAVADGGVNYIALLKKLLVDVGFLSLSFFSVLMLVALLANVLQTGVVLSADPLKPDWSRINPAAGVKRFFSMQTLFSLLKTCLKLLVIAPVVYFTLKGMVPHLYQIASLSPLVFLKTLVDDVASVGFKLSLVLLIIALVDMSFSRRQFMKKMRMSMRDIKDEVKNREGHPRIRSRMRELRQEVYRRSMAIANTAQADVLITNPTHVAVALKYAHGDMAAPKLLSKGAGVVAALMRKIAISKNIPIVQNRKLARALYKNVDYEQYVTEQYYAEVAKIIVWVFAMRQKQNVKVVKA